MIIEYLLNWSARGHSLLALDDRGCSPKRNWRDLCQYLIVRHAANRIKRFVVVPSRRAILITCAQLQSEQHVLKQGFPCLLTHHPFSSILIRQAIPHLTLILTSPTNDMHDGVNSEEEEVVRASHRSIQKVHARMGARAFKSAVFPQLPTSSSP